MTALPLDDFVPENGLKVEGKNPYIRGITIRNIVTHAHSAIMLCESVQDILIENVTCQGSANNIGIRFVPNFECKNLTIRNVTLRGDDMDSVCYIGADPKKLEDLTIEHVRATKAKHLFRQHEVPVKDLVCDELTEEAFCPDTIKFPSAYSRYNRHVFGKAVEIRPADNYEKK